MRFDPDFRPFVAPKNLYIVPLSRDPSQHRVLIPGRLTSRLPDLLIQDKLVIRSFKDCPTEAIATIKAQLRRSLRSRGPLRFSARMNQLLVAGTALVVLGIINFTFPDPLPLADELLLIGVGAGMGIIGYRNRRKVLPLLRDKVERATSRLDKLENPHDLLLTRIHEAIRARGASTPEIPAEQLVDPFELESRWLVDYLDLQQLIDSKAITVEQIDSLLRVLSDAFPLPKFLALERKLRGDPKDGESRNARDRLADRYGLSADAFTVYAEFYRLAREIVTGGRA